MFDIDDFLTSTEIDVNATEIRFKDNRTGDVMTRTVYRPGKRVSFNTLAKELQTYGYTLLWVSDAPGDLPGRLNWSELFGYFLQHEGAEQ